MSQRVELKRVFYHAYDPVVINYRATVIGRVQMSYEKKSWEELFKLLKQLYPRLEVKIPDKIPLIEFDENFKPI